MLANPLPRIDLALCTGCRRCVEVCPTQALTQPKDKAELTYPDRCTYCTECEQACPEGAISLPFVILLSGSKRARNICDRSSKTES
ncbi:MAG: 4Fe-4S binding protein [Caldilineaceae bacterium]|nr:4Fe-4S binding protein [Caldilineaceae bacterium]